MFPDFQGDSSSKAGHSRVCLWAPLLLVTGFLTSKQWVGAAASRQTPSLVSSYFALVSNISNLGFPYKILKVNFGVHSNEPFPPSNLLDNLIIVV